MPRSAKGLAVAGLAAAAAASLVLAFALRKRRAVHGTPDEEDKKLRRKERKARKDAAKASKKLSKKLGKANASSVDPGGGASPAPTQKLESSDAGFSLFGGPWRGEDKYTGAAPGDDGCLYAVPGSARHVVKIDPRTVTAEFMSTVCDDAFVSNALPRGKFKWLRGVPAEDSVVEGPTAAIYGIPCNAHAVLKVVPRTGQVATLTSWVHPRTGQRVANPKLEGTFKWHGGAKSSADGNIYCVPASSDRVLMIVPKTGEVRLVGPSLLPELGRGEKKGPLDFGGRWYGGVLGSDGCIYGMPCNADCVLKIKPAALVDKGKSKKGNDNSAAGSAPGGSEVEVCFTDPEGDPEVTTLPVEGLELGNWDYHGGVATQGGRVLLAVPMHAQRVLAIFPEHGCATLVGEAIPQAALPPADSPIRAALGPKAQSKIWQTGRYQFGGAVLAPNGASAYFLPYDALQVLKVSPKTLPSHSAKKTLPELESLEVVPLEEGRCVSPQARRDFYRPNKWQNGIVGSDGLIYAIPVSANAVLVIDPENDRVSTVAHDVVSAAGGWDKWEGGAVAPSDGALYCVPQCGSGVLRILR